MLRVSPVLTVGGLSVQDEFIFKRIVKLCQTRCRVLIVEIPVDCCAAHVLRSRLVAKHLEMTSTDLRFTVFSIIKGNEIIL
jgi:hypothetical protein